VNTGRHDNHSWTGEGGQITMPIDKVFWSDAFGMLTDRFGTPWMVSAEHKPQ
jgi:PhnB protein